MYQDISQLIKDIRGNWKVVSDHYQYARNKFFYRDDFISLLLFNRGLVGLPKTEFIDYNAAFDYYGDAHKQFNLQLGEQDRSITIPYAELINFVENPNAKILVDGDITPHDLPQDILNNTNDLFAAYAAKHTQIHDGPTLRVADFQQADENTYKVKLQNSHYFSEVRTSLSLDFPLDADFMTTRRIEDLGPDNQLRPLNESQMVNNIGVFSVMAFRAQGYWYFHMLPRHKSIGVFAGMLSSVGGTVESPQQPITDLVDHVSRELIREIREEVGLDMFELAKTKRCQVIPLAFTRELSRGGHPQFFYLTVMEELSDKELSAAFKRAEWSGEFRNDMFSQIRGLDDVISPEFASCLLYAYSYLQKRRKLPGETLRLG